MTKTETLTRPLPEVLEDFRFAMLVTRDGTARPLTVQETTDDVVRFLVDADAPWTGQVDGQPVTLTLADPGKSSFASVTGTASLSADRALVERLYDPEADVFFTGVDDPRIRVVTVQATDGEWWDSPHGRVGQVVALVRAKVTHDPDKVGDSGAIDLR